MSDVKIYANVIEDEAKNQIDILSQQKSFNNQKIRIMPDVHAGKGCVIGFTSTIGDYIIPNVVGVDIGCGILTIELNKEKINLEEFDNIIRENIPSGRNTHNLPPAVSENLYYTPWGKSQYTKMDLRELRCYDSLKGIDRIMCSIGTLGGGNHFIEIDRDDEENDYLIIHTGSRNLGKQVAEYYQNLAYSTLCGKDKLQKAREELITQYKEQGRDGEIQQGIKELKEKFVSEDSDIPKDLAYLTGQNKDDYLHDMAICQDYATINRSYIARTIYSELGHPYWIQPRGFETVHNYIDIENNIIRKGAINADEGKRLLIPLNMRDGCIIGIGKGNPDWNNSAPHGAGRIMSRMKAKATFSMDEYRESMKDVFTTSVSEDTLDELPMAYKDAKDIIDVIGDTVEIQKIVKPVYNFKANE